MIYKKNFTLITKFIDIIYEAKQNSNTHNDASAGIDDFSELKNYVVGESQARVAWKQLARGQAKLSKHYQNQQSSIQWLKLSDMPSTDLEIKLSFLCFLILEYGKSENDFGLLLDFYSDKNNDQTMKITPSSGYQHQQNCLIALASFKNSVNG